jgi:uncharacterized protein (TIGR03546 family)
MMLHLLVKLFKALNANQQPGQLALSFVLGMILGLTPFWSPHTLFILLLIIVLRINLTAVLVAWTFFTGVAYLLDPVFDQVGYWVLHQPAFQPIFTEWYNTAFWRWMNFNYTIVMGSIVVSLAMAPVAFVLFLILIKAYRQRFLTWFNRFKIVKMLKAADTATQFNGGAL